MRCPTCDRQISIGSRYCIHCGATLTSPGASVSGSASDAAPLIDTQEELDCIEFIIQEIEASLFDAVHPPHTLEAPLTELHKRQHDLEERLLQLFVELPTGEATSHIKDFLRLHPWNASAHRNLGSIYSRIGQDDWAVDETVLTILSGSEQAEAHLRLAQLYERMGRKVEALYEYRTCEGLEPPPGLKNTAITKANNLDRELFGPDRGSAEAIVATLYRVETLLSTLEGMDTATPEESDFVDELLETFPQRLALRTAPDRRQWMREAGYNLALMREVEQWSGRGIISQDSAARVHSHLREQCETLEQILGDDYSAEPASPSDQYSDHVAVQLDRFFEQRLLERHEYQALIASYLPQPRPAVAVAGAPATARPAMPPAPPRQPRPPAPPREPFDWGAFWLGMFSERTLVTVLGFGVLLVAISSLVLLVNSWGDFSWYIRQAFLIGQFFMFLAVGYTLMNRLNLHLSGLALITIASLWVPLNIGALVFEFIPAPAEMLLPGIDIPMDLPIHGWLIITGVTFPIWALFTFKFRGHVHAHGTVWAAGATVALALSVSGLQWEWSVASLAVMTIPLAFVWERMRHTSYRPIAEPLFWTSQSILVSITGVLLIGWLLGNASGYSLATVGLAGTALYVIFNHYSPRLVYQYLFSSLPVIAVLFAMGESRILPLRYFDALLIVFGIVYVISGARWESKYVSGRLRSAYWPVFQPVYAAGYLCALLAVLWPAYDPISRAFALFGATAIATYSAYRWSRVYWTSTASVLLVAAILLSLDSLGQIDPIYWGIGLGILAWAYLAAGVVMRRAPIHAFAVFTAAFCLSTLSLVWTRFSGEPLVVVITLPMAIGSYVTFSVLSYRGRQATIPVLQKYLAGVMSALPLSEKTLGLIGSAAFMALAGLLIPLWTIRTGRWMEIPFPWEGLDFIVLAFTYAFVGVQFARRDLVLHSKVILALAGLLAIAAPLYNVASAGPGWTLAGMLYADVAAAGFAAYALRRQSLAYIAGALLTVPYALTLHLVGVTSEQWAIPWAGLAVAYFTGSIVLRRYPSIAGPLISLSYVLTAAALIWAAFDSTGVVARWTLPLVVAIYCASAFLIHRGRISTRLKILAPVYGGRSVSGEDRGREAVVVTFILAVAVIAPVWTALMLAWLGVEGSVHGVSLLAWAFLFGAVGHLVLRRTSNTYNYALLGAGIIAALVAVSVSLVYGDRTVTTGVLYGVSALAFLYHFYIRSEFPLYLALVLLLAPMGMTLDLLGLEALMWGTPLMVLAVAYLGTGLLMQRRRRTKAFATLYEVGFVMSGVALAWTVFWVAVTSLELARAENITLLAQRLLASATLFLGAGAYIVAAYRREDRTFGYLASIVMAGAIGLVIMASPLNLRHATIAVAAIGAAYVLIGSWGLRARMSNRTGSEDDIRALPTPSARLATAFRWPLIATGYFIASVSLLIATYDLTDGSGQVLPANMVYLINVALLAAHARVARASGLAYGAVLLFVLPFTLTVYDIFGETNDLAVFPSAALSFGWVGLALAYIGLGQLAERIRGKHALALIAPGYALLIASVLPAFGSAERQSVVFGAIVAVAAVSAFLVHRGAAPHTIEYVATKLSWPLQIARRHLVTGLIAVAALLSPQWSLEVLALFTREAPIQGLVLALEAPLFLLVGTLIFKRIDRLYAWTVLFAAYGMSVIAVLFTLNDEVIRLVTLLAATAVFVASLAIFRRGEWLYPLLISAHLSVVAFLTLPQLDISQSVMGIIFVPITLGMAVGLGISMRDAKDKNIKVMLKPWTTPFILFGVVDLSASLVLAAGENWSGFVVTITYAVVTAIGAYISRNRLAPYVSTAFLTLSVMFASRMFGLSWSQSAIVWATQGFIMWWMSQTANALSRRGSPEGVPRAELAIWVNPLRSSGIRLSWIALAFVVAVFFLGLYAPDRFGAAQVDDATAVVSILGLLYLGIAFVGRRPLFGYLAVGLLLISWLIQLGDREIPFAQAYAIPAGLYLLGIAFFERRRSPGRLAAFIDMAAVLLLVVSAFWQSVTDDAAWAYALLTGVEAVLLVFWGALNRTKVPFFGGIAAFILNVLYQSTALLSTLPGAVTGLVIGIVLVALIVVIEWRRQQLVALGKKWSGRLDDWAW